MPKRITVIQGHPDPGKGRLGHALADAYAAGASRAGANVRTVHVAGLDFPLLQTPDDFYLGAEGTPASLVKAQQAITTADHIAVFYPLWLGGMPAVLKGFFEQTLRPGIALDDADGGFPKPMLRGKSARIVVTMGMPTVTYRWRFGAHSLKAFEKSILGFAGVGPIRESLFGGVDAAPAKTREQWLEQMQRTGARDGRPAIGRRWTWSPRGKANSRRPATG